MAHIISPYIYASVTTLFNSLLPSWSVGMFQWELSIFSIFSSTCTRAEPWNSKAGSTAPPAWAPQDCRHSAHLKTPCKALGELQCELDSDWVKVRPGFSCGQYTIRWQTKDSSLLTFTWRSWPHPSSWTSGNILMQTVSEDAPLIPRDVTLEK